MPVDFVITAKVNAQVNQASVANATNALRGAFQGINTNVGVSTGPAVAGLQKVTSGAQASAAALRQMQAQAASTSASLQATVTVTNAGASSLRNFGDQAGLAARRFVAFSVAAGSIVTAVRGIQEGVRAAVDFQLSMNKVQQVSGEAASKMGALRAEIGSLSTSLGVSSAALAETAITLKQAGLSIDQTKGALKALALTDLAPTFDSMKQSTEGLIAAFRQFNLSSGQFEQTLGAMNAVAGKFAVESSDIISAVQRAGGAFKLTAGDMKSGSEALNEFMALFTSVRATTRESADSIATGLRTVFTRFQRGDTVKALGDLGINLRYTREEARALGNTNLTDQFVGAYEAVRRLSEGLEGLRETDPRYAQVVEQLGGYRQISRVVPLLKEFKTAEEAKNIAVAGGLSLQLAAEKRQESLSNKISKLKEEYLELFRKITESKSFQSLANTMLGVASSFAKVIDYARPLLPLLTALAAVKVGLNIGNIAGAFTRAFVAPPGAIVSGAKAGAGVTRFASGGHVPGVGNTDTVRAVLTPGEFVLKKRAAERIGYHKLHQMNERPERFAEGGRVPTGGRNDETGEYTPPALSALPPGAPRVFAPLPKVGPRRPLGPRANDALIQALSLLTAPGRRRFDAGGRVTAPRGADAIRSVLAEFSESTGIPYRSLVSSVKVVSDLKNEYGTQRRSEFRPASRELLINRDLVRDAEQLRRTVFHELGHGLDLRIGGGSALGSTQTGTPAALAAGAYSGRLGRSSALRNTTERYRAYATAPHEAFAEAVADTYVGAGARGQSLLTESERTAFERKVVAPARAQINYGFIDPAFAAKRRVAAASRTGLFGAFLSGAAKLFGYANGGFVPGAGNNDTEPAMLMPGEF
ncbi:MAG TPA: phage tail tape measure protein, partial [Gemmata sp.]